MALRQAQGPDWGLKVEICPNSYEIPEQVRSDGGEEIPGQARDDVRAKYGLPADKPILIYGGNLGKPQGIPCQ